MSIKRLVPGRQRDLLALFVTEATIPECYLFGGLVGLMAIYWLWRLDFSPVNLFEPENDVE